MTNNNLGGNFGSSIGTYGAWTGVVVNRNDPLKAGRVQIRVHGAQDDQINVPDNMLPWVTPQASIHSGSINHIGLSPTGIMVGSTVRGSWADPSHTIPVFSGTLPRAEIKQNSSASPSNQPNPYSQIGEQAKSTPELQNDVSHNARGVKKTGAPNESNMGKDYNSVLKNSHTKEALNAISLLNQNLPFKIAKFPSLPTIAGQAFQEGQKVLNLIKQVDPNNKSGSIQTALKGMIGLKNLTDASSMMAGVGNMSGMFSSLLSGSGGNIAQAILQLGKQLLTDASTIPVSPPNYSITLNTTSNTFTTNNYNTYVFTSNSIVDVNQSGSLIELDGDANSIVILTLPLATNNQLYYSIYNNTGGDQGLVSVSNFTDSNTNSLIIKSDLTLNLFADGNNWVTSTNTLLQPPTVNTTSITTASQNQNEINMIMQTLQSMFSNVPGAPKDGQGSFNHMQGVLKRLENEFAKIKPGSSS